MPVMQTPTRKAARQGHRVIVPVRCGRCEWTVAELYGPDESTVTNYWSRSASGALSLYGRVARWRCRCGMDYPLRGEKLAVAFQRAAAHSDTRRRVVTLPNDLQGI